MKTLLFSVDKLGFFASYFHHVTHPDSYHFFLSCCKKSIFFCSEEESWCFREYLSAVSVDQNLVTFSSCLPPPDLIFCVVCVCVGRMVVEKNISDLYPTESLYKADI